MAVENFADLLHKLKEVHDQEVEGWQEKVLELTNKKNCDAKRLEELYNRNQQLREQQKMLTENIKQLENMLRAGLCDRCTVTQEVAKKRQQEYESSQLQSLQHISLMSSEISTLMKDNDRLKEEVKSLRGRIEKQNGHSEEAVTPEVKPSPSPGAAALTLVTSVLKQVQQPTGGTTSLTSTLKNESEAGQTTDNLIERQTPEKRVEHKLQAWSGTHQLDSRKPLTLSVNTTNPVAWKERRATSVDSAELLSSSLPSPLFSHLRQLKSNPFFPSVTSEERHTSASVPLRPHPIKTAPATLPWPPPEHPDWVPTITGTNRTNRGILGQTNSLAILRFPGLVPLSSSHESHQQTESSSRLKFWTERPTSLHRRSLSELGDGKERKSTVSVISPPCWKKEAAQTERIFGENLREGEVEVPLDLSNGGGGGGGNKDKETELVRNQSQCDTALSSSSSSPAAPLSSPSSSHCVSSPQSDVQKEETLERRKEEGEDEQEKNGNAEVSEKPKVPTLSISLRPVVVLESLQSEGQKEQELEQEEGEEDHQGTARKRTADNTEDFPGLTLSHRLKEKRIKMTVGLTKTTQGSNHGDSEEG